MPEGGRKKTEIRIFEPEKMKARGKTGKQNLANAHEQLKRKGGRGGGEVAKSPDPHQRWKKKNNLVSSLKGNKHPATRSKINSLYRWGFHVGPSHEKAVEGLKSKKEETIRGKVWEDHKAQGFWGARGGEGKFNEMRCCEKWGLGVFVEKKKHWDQKD